MRKLTPITESQALMRSLKSFDNYRGAIMPENPKCQKDINELVNPIDGKSALDRDWETYAFLYSII